MYTNSLFNNEKINKFHKSYQSYKTLIWFLLNNNLNFYKVYANQNETYKNSTENSDQSYRKEQDSINDEKKTKSITENVHSSILLNKDGLTDILEKSKTNDIESTFDNENENIDSSRFNANKIATHFIKILSENQYNLSKFSNDQNIFDFKNYKDLEFPEMPFIEAFIDLHIEHNSNNTKLVKAASILDAYNQFQYWVSIVHTILGTCSSPVRDPKSFYKVFEKVCAQKFNLDFQSNDIKPSPKKDGLYYKSLHLIDFS